MITNFIIFIVGGILGVITTALAVVAGDAERCEDCMRMREELENERLDKEGRCT